jgi:hypothetical protein
MGSEESGPTGDDGSRHGERWYKDAPGPVAGLTEPLPHGHGYPTNRTRTSTQTALNPSRQVIFFPSA